MEAPTRRVVRASGVEIDLDTGLVQRNGNPVYLRQKSQRVLACLLEYRRQPVSKDQLISMVWNGSALSDEVLTGCIREIRKALGDDARQPTFIRTMPKNGYWFIAPVEEIQHGDAAGDAMAAPADSEPPRNRRWKWLVAAGLLTAAVCAAFLFRPRDGTVDWDEVAWWRLEEGAGTLIRDSVSGLTAPVPAGIGWAARTGERAALEFRGADTAIMGESSGSLPRGPAPRTMMAWVKPAAGPPDSSVFFQYGARGGDHARDAFFLMIHHSGKAGFGNGSAYALTGAPAGYGAWRHVAGVYDGTSATVYLDGVEASSVRLNKEQLAGDGPTSWSVGRAIHGGTPFRGELADIRVFARALRAADVQALYRCAQSSTAIEVTGRGASFFAPVLGMSVAISEPLDGESSPRIRNVGKDYAGVSFVKSPPVCGWKSTWASDMGQDLDFEMEVRVGGSPGGPIASAGPYLRSRKSAPGDGIIGGKSAGYWAELLSTGQVRVKRLYPAATVAFSDPVAGFDPGQFHKFRVTAQGSRMDIWVDGKAVTFDQSGVTGTQVELPAVWESVSPRGENQGAAGIAFGCEGYRNQTGGQEIRNLRLRALN